MKLPRVLLVDDTPEILALCQELLRPNFEIVGAATDGHSAIALLTTTTPDVVVLDIAMPGLDGLEVAGRLRSAGCQSAIVFFSVDMDFLMADGDHDGRTGSRRHWVCRKTAAYLRPAAGPPRSRGGAGVRFGFTTDLARLI